MFNIPDLSLMRIHEHHPLSFTRMPSQSCVMLLRVASLLVVVAHVSLVGFIHYALHWGFVLLLGTFKTFFSGLEDGQKPTSV